MLHSIRILQPDSLRYVSIVKRPTARAFRIIFLKIAVRFIGTLIRAASRSPELFRWLQSISVQPPYGTFNLHDDAKLTPMTLKRRCGPPTEASAVMVAHRLLPYAMHSDVDNAWPVRSLMLPIHDLRGLPL